MIVTNARGDVLVELIRGGERTLLADDTYEVTRTLVVAEHRGRFLFMLNRWRHKWEVPGGKLESGESPRACAERELAEETGGRFRDLRFAGLMHFRLQPDDRTEFGALYVGELEDPTELSASDEALEVILWDLERNIGEVDAIDRALVDFHTRRSAG